MGNFIERMIDAGQDENQLYQLYNENAGEFNENFPVLLDQYPDSAVLQNWQKKYVCQPTEIKQENAVPENDISFISTFIWIIFVLVAYFIAIKSIPIDLTILIRRYLDSTTIFMITVFFMVKKKRGILVFLLAFILAFAGFYSISLVELVLFSYKGGLVDIHMPYYFLIVFGVAYVGYQIRNPVAWKSYFIYLAKLLLYLMAFVIVVKIVSGLSLKGIKIIDPYFLAGQYELQGQLFRLSRIIGTVVLPFLSIYMLEKNYKPNNVLFAPLIIIFQSLVIFHTILFFVVFNFYRVYFEHDGSFSICKLIVYSIVLITLYVFAKLPINKKTFYDNYIFSTLIFTWGLDLLTLVATVQKMSSQITPARVTGLISLFLLFLLMSGFIYFYTGFLYRKKELILVQRWIYHFIPVFTIWILLMTITFPIIFYNFHR